MPVATTAPSGCQVPLGGPEEAAQAPQVQAAVQVWLAPGQAPQTWVAPGAQAPWTQVPHWKVLPQVWMPQLPGQAWVAPGVQPLPRHAPQAQLVEQVWAPPLMHAIVARGAQAPSPPQAPHW